MAYVKTCSSSHGGVGINKADNKQPQMLQIGKPFLLLLASDIIWPAMRMPACLRCVQQ
jgi:hypothetical protein